MIAYLPKEKLEFEIREGVKDDKDVLWEQFGENVYRVDAERLSQEKVVLDIGANIGAFSIHAASLAEGVNVIAVEPEPHNLELLKKNIELNHMEGVIKVYPLAVHAKGVETVTIGDMAGSSREDYAVGLLPIPVIDLDTLLNAIRSDYGYKKFDMLKVDVEGAEYAIFRSASNETMKKFAYIALEFHANIDYDQFSSLVLKLTETHSVNIIGSWDKGGNIYAWRYEDKE